jgi:hypothetical protein
MHCAAPRTTLRAMRSLRLASAAALCAAAFLSGTSSAAERCARTPGSLYWEVCAGRGDCLVYVWSTMPPAVCA